MNHTLLKVPFDEARWQSVAAERYPEGLPNPHSLHATEWLFSGHRRGWEHPSQVAAARLAGYQRPRQTGSSLGDWLERQRADRQAGVEGADARVAAAEHMKRELGRILEGENPYDICVRWKPLSGQPIGWAPDINDGVRQNIRPFLTPRRFAGLHRQGVRLPRAHGARNDTSTPTPWPGAAESGRGGER